MPDSVSTYTPKAEYPLEHPSGKHGRGGSQVRAFEEAFAKHAGRKHAIFVNSGSTASLLAFWLPIAIDRDAASANRRVILPAVCWPTAVAPAIQFGYAPVLCDVDPQTWTIDPERLALMCEKAAPAIVLVDHVLGTPAAFDKIEELHKKYGFLLIEDCRAAGFGPGTAGKLGRVGEIAIYSTRSSTGEGGVLCVGNEQAPGTDGANILRMLRDHGRLSDCDAATRTELLGRAKVDPFLEPVSAFVPGFNARAMEAAADRGLAALSAWPAEEAAARANQAAYLAAFSVEKSYTVQAARDGSAPSAFGVLAASKAHRARVLEALAAKKIGTAPISGGNIGRQPFWTAVFDAKRERPNADAVHDRGFTLPLHAGITVEDARFIADTVLAVKPDAKA